MTSREKRVLEGVYNLFDDPKRFCAKGWAQTIEGEYLAPYEIFLPKAYSWCTSMAIHVIARRLYKKRGKTFAGNIARKTNKKLMEFIGPLGYPSVIEFHNCTNYETVRSVLRRTIAEIK